MGEIAQLRFAPMHQVNHGSEARQIRRLFAGRIAAADDDLQRLLAKHRQRAVAGCLLQ